MKMETLKDILHWTAEFHQNLSIRLVKCVDENENENERVKMLLDYLVEHESRLKRLIEKFEQTATSSALNTWVCEYFDQYLSIQIDGNSFEALDTVGIMAVITELHQQLIELYRYLLTRVDAPSARELLDSLKSLEEHEVMLISQGANYLEDI